MQTRLGVVLAASLLAVIPLQHATRSHGAALHADTNDERTPAGVIVDGELRVDLDVVDITWSPRGPSGPQVPAVGFADRGHTPQMPGPLLRMRAGTPVRVSVRNTLARAVRVRGLGDRVPGDTAIDGLPGFMRAPALRLAPGEVREVRFTPTHAVTSFYFARRLPQATDTLAEEQFASPGIGSTEGGLVGAFIVDPADAAPPANERIFVLTGYASRLERADVTWHLSINGLSWPHTERLAYEQGDTVRWRVINASGIYHPMHLHGFYFAVTSRGDTQADTATSAPRALEVTEGMREFSSMRLSWVADRPGNWLFHCHLIRHSSETQKYSAESLGDGSMSDMPAGGASEHGMGGLIVGITVHPRTAVATVPPANARRLDLWTGARPRVFGDSAGYGFVLQRGDRPPAPDSIEVPGSSLVLERGEPTRIVVHNRLPFPLGVHWHGLELESYYDGVGGWSGAPGNTRGMIPAGDTMSVFITPPRSGTFMYHTHGELGAALAQGLYGTLIVTDGARALDTDTDRLFVLASRGATRDADVAINGRGIPANQRFVAGRTYRLRFTHISMDDVKNVRLLLNGKPVTWRPLARDGATLPTALRVESEATQRMDVGETFDFEWTPKATGVYLLEVDTDYYPARGGSTVVQRMAFGVGSVSDAEMRMASVGTSLAVGDPTGEALHRFVGAYVSSTSAPSPDVVSVWLDSTGLATSRTVGGVESAPMCLIPLADEGATFVGGSCENGFLKEATPRSRYRFDGSNLNTSSGSFRRVAGLPVTESEMARFVGRYQFGFVIENRGGVLTLTEPDRTGTDGSPLMRVSGSRFVGMGGPTPWLFQFSFKGDSVVSFSAGIFGIVAQRIGQ